MTYVLAVDVGGTTIKAELADESGGVAAKGSAPTPKGAAALDAVAELGSRLISSVSVGADVSGSVAGAGVVLPGIVDRTRRLAVYSANVGWRDLPAGELLERAWGIPVAVDHDVTCAGWAEWATGAGQGSDEMAFVAIGTGISAAIVSGGRLFRGSGGRQPGEIGHVVVRPGGPLCGCGARGCLESIASATSIARSYAAVSGAAVSGALDVELAATRDNRARKVWDDAMSALADGLTVLATLFAPERIVIGGGLGQSGDYLLTPLVSLLPDRIRVQPVPALALARHGTRAGLAGAALLARHGKAP